MRIRMLRNLIGVEKLGKPSKQSGGIFIPLEDAHNVGVIRYVGEELKGKFEVGQRVHIGNQREQIRMNGAEIMVMEEKNVFAIVEVEDADQKTEDTPA